MDVDRGSYRFNPVELGHALFFQHCPCRFHNQMVFHFSYAILSLRVSVTEFTPNSHLLQITLELAGRVLFSTIRPQALDIPVGRLRRPSIKRAKQTKDADKLGQKGQSRAEGSVGLGALTERRKWSRSEGVTTRVMMRESEREKVIHAQT